MEKMLSAVTLAEKIKSKEIKVSEVIDFVENNVNRTDKVLNCYTVFDSQKARERAEVIQRKIDRGEVASPLAGIPIGIKDNICSKGELTTCSSKILSGFRPPYNATVIERLNDADMITLGKLNMDEFAMGSTTETSFYGPTKNPWDIQRVPGGSSGGSAAAVAAGEAVCALGSDTGGSIRQPAAFCGVTGLKPTYGSVSRYGLIAYASSLDQIGPLAQDALDAAAVYSVISGKDSGDGTSMEFPPLDYSAVESADVKGKKIGIPEQYFGDGLNSEVAQAVMSVAEVLESRGAIVERFQMPIAEYAIPTYYIIACAEACSNLSRFDGIKYGYSCESAEDLLDVYVKSRSEGFGYEVKKRIMLGNFVLSSGYYDAYYNKALQVKAQIISAFNEAFERYDMILGPVAPTTALKMGENLSNPLQMYLGDIYTVMINIAGLPSVSVPCGFDKSGLPIGAQIIGKPFGEEQILSAAHAFQLDTDHHLKRPKSPVADEKEG